MPLRLVVIAVLATALAVPAVVQAKLPTPKTRTIVLKKSIGGVELGMSLAKAKAAWGPGSKCGKANYPAGATQCVWATGPGNLTARLQFTVSKGKVVTITVLDGTGGTAAGIRKYRTAKGTAVGATLAAVKKAYPALGPLSGSPSGASAELGTGATKTSFFFVDGKLDSLSVGG